MDKTTSKISKEKLLKEMQRIMLLTQDEREVYIHNSAKYPELNEFAKNLQIKVMSAIAIAQKTVIISDDAELAEKKYLKSLTIKNKSAADVDEQHTINIELADMARTAFIAARGKLVVKAVGGRRRNLEYDPNFYTERLYKLFEIITKISEKIYYAQQNKSPKEFIDTLELCYEQVITRYFDFFLEGVGKALENKDQLTVSRLRIVCSLHAGLVDSEQRPKGKKIPNLAKQTKIIEILNKCIKAMEKRSEE